MPPAAQAASVRKDFFRALELPELDEAVRQATSSLTTTTAVGVATAESSIATVTATATVKNGHGGGGGGGAPPQMWSACPHWVDYLPSKLDLTLYPCAAPVGDDHSHNQDHSSHKNHHKWILKEPVHALHLQSQLEQGCCLFSHDEPILYGEEQERWMAVCTEGFPETYHPWIQSTTPAKAAKLPQALASSSSSSRPRSEAAAAFHLPLPALNHATTAVNRHHLSAEHVPTPLPDSETTLAPSSSTRTTTMPPTLHDASSSFVTATHKSKLATAAPASLHTTAATLFVDATKKSISSGVAVPPPTTWSSTVNKPTSTPATVAATVSAATLQTPPQQPDCSMDIQVDASTTTTSPLLVPPHYLPESTYLSLQFLADQIALLRRYFLAQRTQKKPDPPVSAKVDPTAVTSTAATTTTAPMSATTAPTTTGATRKRKTASGGTSSSAGEVFHPPPLCQMPAWKLWHTTTNTATAAANRTIPMARSNEDEWHARQRRAAAKVEVWMEHYRQSRQCYWSETTATRQQSSLCHPPPPTTRFRSELSPTTVFGSITTQVPSLHNNSNNNNNHSNESGGDNNKSPRRCTTSSSRSCQWCQRNGGRQRFRLGSAAPDEKTNATKGRLLQGDDLMQCLECSFTGCCPSSVHPLSNQHIVEHFLTSNHKYGACWHAIQNYIFLKNVLLPSIGFGFV